MSTTVDLGKITASVTVGTTTTGAAGTNASVSNSGTTQDAVLNFTIPRGAQGVQGPQGSTGPAGPAGPTGPQGPMGDVAVITPEQQAAFTMYSVPGQNTDGPMTQKAVTDALVAGSISYDNSQSGLASTNVQGALDNISEKTVIIGNPIVLSFYTAQNYYINNSGVWKSANPLASKWLPVKAGIKYRLVGRYGRTCNYAFVKNDSHVVNHQADFADGTSRSQLISDSVVILTAPPDAKFLCVLVVGSDGLDSSPADVSVVEYIDDVVSQTSIQVWDDASRIGMTAIGEIPVLEGGYQGVNNNLLYYSVTRKTRLMVVLPTDSVAFIQPKGTYMMSTCLFQDSMPTDKFMVVNASLTNEFVDVQKCLEDAVGFTPNHIAINIAKGDNTEFTDIPPLSEMLNIVPLRSTSVRVFRLQQGYFSGTTGLYPTITTFYKGLNGHYPRYIRFAGMIRITNTEDVGGRIYWYDKSQNFLGSDVYGTNNRLFVHPQAYYFRIGVRYDTNPPVDTLEIESYWDYVPFPQEISEKLPSDEGYTNLTFPVNILKPNASNTLGVEEQYIRAVDFGVLHLPTDYTPYGSPTPLIIYLHGAAERYTSTSNRFGTNVRYSPEWSAAGYAQMDVNMAPDCFPYTGSNLGTGDDVSCVYAAYQWVIEHYNIRRDGVYLFGRSRGAQAVMSILAQYNADKMPIVCALSNAGANSMILLALHRASTAQWWTAFCDSMGLPDSAHGRPAFGSGIVVSQPNLVTFLRNNIELWWKKSLTGFPTVIDNPTDYKTPLQIFNLMVDSYNDSQDAGRAYLDFVQACTYRSPVPLRFDWCVGDTNQPWAAHNYGWAGMKAFVDSYLTGDAIYRQWPSCTDGNPHYHEKFNLISSYTLPNGVTVTDASMAQIEWLLWAQSHDNRAITNYRG